MPKYKGLYAEERKEKIIEILESNKKISVPEMCDLFGVSPSTIRNDLTELEQSGLIKRTHGGALLASKVSFEPMPKEKDVIMLNEKKSIARQAAELVENGDIIAIDTGTTTLEFAKSIINKKDITVILNDLRIARFLEDYTDFNIILLGGNIRNKYHYTYNLNHDFLHRINVDKAFMSCNGLSITKGITTPDMNLAELKRDIINIAGQTILMCDSSKIDQVSFAQIVPITKIHCIVTDSGLEKDYIEKLKGFDIRVISAE